MATQTEEQPPLDVDHAEMKSKPLDDESLEDDDNKSNKSALLSRKVHLIELKLENVTYSPVTTIAGKKGKASSEKKRTTVLNNITTTISPYKLTAWMGPSGSGKTSMITVAADLTESGDLSSDSKVYINGELGMTPKRLVGVVWQDDLLLSNLTVEENIYFAARLKSPESISEEEVRRVVAETMQELGLIHIRNSLVGSALSAMRGVSGGERKRVSVASELVLRPSLLLLDEPTSGLDATTAQSLIATLRELADIGQSIAVVIHQPRTAIFNMFDHLLLLSKGNMLYDGMACKARHYFESDTCPSIAELPPETGIADWFMDIITQDEHRPEGSMLAKYWAGSTVKESLKDTRPSVRMNRRLSTLEELESAPKYNTSFLTQLKLLTLRTFKQQRGERLTTTALVLQFCYLFVTALFWWRLPNNTAWIFEHNSLFFFMIIAQANGIVISAVTVFQRERTLLHRERAKKMYGVSSYFIAKGTVCGGEHNGLCHPPRLITLCIIILVVSDMTNNVLLPLLYGMIVYWTANFRPTAVAYFQFILAFYLTLSTAQSMGLFISILIPNMMVSLALAPPITLFFMIIGGFYVPFQNMNPVVFGLSWLSFARYGYSALIINEYQGRTIPCASPEDAAVTIGVSDICPLPGEDVIASLGITGVAENFWFNIGLITVLQVAFRLVAYIMLRRTK